MPTNYNILSEEISRAYSRGINREDISPRLDKREIKVYIIQAINLLIKAEVANIGEIPDAVLGDYTVTPTETACLWSASMPAYPVNLPKNQGIWRVYPSGCPWKAYVPIKAGDFDIAQGTPTEFLEGIVGYYQMGTKICFTKQPSETVTLKLVVNDPAIISDTDILPMPAEMESLVIDEVLRRISAGQLSQYELNGKSEQVTPRETDG